MLETKPTTSSTPKTSPAPSPIPIACPMPRDGASAMTAQVVIRRFEIHAAEGDLDGIRDALSAAARPFTDSAQLRIDITRHRFAMASVQLMGIAQAVSVVRESISRNPGVQVVNDWLDAPAAAAPNELYVYPDQRVLRRIDPWD